MKLDEPADRGDRHRYRDRKGGLFRGARDLLGATYWKPIRAGLDGESDTQLVARLGNLSADRIVPKRYRLRTQLRPIIPLKWTEFASKWIRSMCQTLGSDRS